MNGIGLTSRSDVRLPPPTTDSIAGDLANNETPNLKSYNRGPSFWPLKAFQLQLLLRIR